MVSSQKDPQKTSDFYKNLLGLEVKSMGDDFAVLKDPHTGKEFVLKRNQASDADFNVLDLDETLGTIEQTGGRVFERWEYPELVGARCQDPSGNEFLLWQNK